MKTIHIKIYLRDMELWATNSEELPQLLYLQKGDIIEVDKKEYEVQCKSIILISEFKELNIYVTKL